MSVLLLPPIFQFFDDNGDPLAGGFVDTFAAGTTTRLATHTSNTGLTAAPNPIQLDASGRPESGNGAIWGEGAYKFIVRNSAGVQVGDVLDNVTSFTTLAGAANAYMQSFSGNSSQTVFTASDNLGTEEKGLMVFVDNGSPNTATNGTFATDTDWTKGAGWTIGSGVATAAGAISTGISQASSVTLIEGLAYSVTYTITRSAGGLIPSIGGQNGIERVLSGTYREIIIAGLSQTIAFTGNAFTGTLDNVIISLANSKGYEILNPSAYTINGTSLTFASAPKTGTNNIFVFAPSLLLGAASAAAGLAEVYATNALASEIAAAASASLAAASIKVKPAVACATTANITLSGEQTIDTVLTSASRVLVKNQSLAQNNGVYVSAAGAWSRATDADTWTEIQGQSVFTLGGSVNINKTWANTNEAGGTIGVDGITWTELFSAIADNAVTNAKLADMAANTVKVNATAGSADPSDLSITTNTFPARSSSGNIAAKPLTDFALSLLDDADAATARTTLGITAGVGRTLIATSTPTGVSSVDFTSIPQTYRSILLEWKGVSTTGVQTLTINPKFDSTYAARAVYNRTSGGTVTEVLAQLQEFSFATAAQTTAGYLLFEDYTALSSNGISHPIRGAIRAGATATGATTKIRFNGEMDMTGLTDTGLTEIGISTGSNVDAGTFNIWGIL